MKYRFHFLIMVVIVGILSTLLHEFGHCAFYWLQGIHAGMSLTKEFPLRDITSHQYAVGSAGGPIINIILILVASFLVSRYRKKTITWTIFSAVIVTNVFYLVVRSFLALLKRRGGELGSAGNLIGLEYFVVAILFLLIAVAALLFWMRRFTIRSSLRNGAYGLLLFIIYFASLLVIQSIDSKLFWHRFPSVQIDDGRVYNERR
ncbi:MAG: hypothetical protein JSU64_00705 [candidate division WOR-3 bacterium]|nr:MAG: hypothetical protein JSU64_00705 [candidate division WOR-3 bacterium]UCF05602.1 MAG: hypothetical protein JSV33_00780 [bacterium]